MLEVFWRGLLYTSLAWTAGVTVLVVVSRLPQVRKMLLRWSLRGRGRNEVRSARVSPGRLRALRPNHEGIPPRRVV
jgi:hypothetical protein